MNKKYLETIKSCDGIIENLEFHQERLESVCKDLSNADLHVIKNYLNPPKIGTYRCRVVYDEFSLHVSYIPYEKRKIKTLKIVYSDTIEYSKKYLNREEIDELFALRAECDDVLIVKSGLVTDTSIANIAFHDGKNWLTPKRPLLRGTTRERYIKNQKVIEKDIFVDDLKDFTQVALMNAMIDFDIIAQENIGEIIC